jgi:hypothetical protein
MHRLYDTKDVDVAIVLKESKMKQFLLGLLLVAVCIVNAAENKPKSTSIDTSKFVFFENFESENWNTRWITSKEEKFTG